MSRQRAGQNLHARLKPSPSQPGVKATLSSQNFINRFIPNKENITDNYSESNVPGRGLPGTGRGTDLGAKRIIHTEKYWSEFERVVFLPVE